MGRCPSFPFHDQDAALEQKLLKCRGGFEVQPVLPALREFQDIHNRPVQKLHGLGHTTTLVRKSSKMPSRWG